MIEKKGRIKIDSASTVLKINSIRAINARVTMIVVTKISFLMVFWLLNVCLCPHT